MDPISLNPKAVNRVQNTYQEVYQSAFQRLVRDELIDLLEVSPEAYRGLHLWFELLLFSTASIANNKKRIWKKYKPTDLAKYYLANKYNASETEELSLMLSEKLKDVGEASQRGDVVAWLNLFSGCLSAYDIELTDEAVDIAVAIGGKKLLVVQGDVTKSFTKLWKKV